MFTWCWCVLLIGVMSCVCCFFRYLVFDSYFIMFLEAGSSASDRSSHCRGGSVYDDDIPLCYLSLGCVSWLFVLFSPACCSCALFSFLSVRGFW